MEMELNGAVDIDACPIRRIRRNTIQWSCLCGLCALCGFPKHSAVHGPHFGQQAGSKPYDHEYVPIFGSIASNNLDRRTEL